MRTVWKLGRHPSKQPCASGESLCLPQRSRRVLLASGALLNLGRATSHPPFVLTSLHEPCQVHINEVCSAVFFRCAQITLNHVCQELRGWLLFILTFTLTLHLHFIYMYIWLLNKTCATIRGQDSDLLWESPQDDWRRSRLLCVNRKKSVSHGWPGTFHLVPLIWSEMPWLAAWDRVYLFR